MLRQGESGQYSGGFCPVVDDGCADTSQVGRSLQRAGEPAGVARSLAMDRVEPVGDRTCDDGWMGLHGATGGGTLSRERLRAKIASGWGW